MIISLTEKIVLSIGLALFFFAITFWPWWTAWLGYYVVEVLPYPPGW
jgi:uncharacterized membrane protein